ncbi:pancreatic lipase-related protein 2-like isoform X1 [Daphnia pulex]|uniref:pancreatic lipase-related protein 2-like isoform X1 n=1 Tax=Daphnia pulex TaxID=6669 RepID=UPI001EDF95BE|nr:pancreatic lipase-related protein 2-like isoform X1 [Daphnia pulex]
MTTASVWIISFVFLVFTGSALTGPLARESCVNESKNRVSRDFRALIKHGRDYHKDLVQKQEPRTAVLQTADVQQLDSKMEPITYCYGEIGCIVIDDSWYDPVHRPINQEPLPREKINTRFILHTRQRPTQDTMLYANDLDSIRYSTFDPTKPTQFLVHGFIDDGTVRWMKRLTENLLSHGDYNVIIVNWGGGSLPMYSQATANTRVVGLEIAYMVNTMITHFGVDPGMVHLLGHSLGAHTVGYAGEGIEGLGRITGLDPAEPYFAEMPSHVRLDPTDAKFVDAIHTDTRTILLLGYGMLEPVGHLDFYPNGGRDQPGCDPVNIPLDMITEDMVTGGRELVACNHLRCIEFFIDSLVPGYNYVGYECIDNDAFHRGECHSCGADNLNCAKFGMDAALYPTRDRTYVHLLFDTGKDVPYIKYHYSIKVNLAYPPEAEAFVYGTMRISLYGTLGQLIDLTIAENSQQFVHGADTFLMFIDSFNVGNIQRVELYWKYDGTIFNTCGLFCNDHIYVRSVEISELNNYPESSRLEHTYKSCVVGADYVDMKDKSWAEFYPTACV